MRMLLAVLFFLGFSSALGAERVCGRVYFLDGAVELSDNEKILVCGTSKSLEAWRSVPLEQARYQMNVLLQNAGYFSAQFDIQDEKLLITKGSQTTTSEFVMRGDPALDLSEKRKVVGAPLSSKKLDEVKTWADLKARRGGHACPEVNVRAEVWRRSMLLELSGGPRQQIGTVNRTGYGDLDPDSIRRFEAFREGQAYNVLETQITTDRLMAQGLFQNAYITTECRGDIVDLNFVTEVGRPRLLRFSFGGSSEEFPFVDIWFKNTRLDRRASSFTTQIHLSPLSQSFLLDSEFFIFPNSKTTHFGPRFKAERKKEELYESNKIEAGADLERGWDQFGLRLHARVGPTMNYLRTVSGQGPPEKTYLSWEGEISAVSHNYEAFTRQQFEGWMASLKYTGQRKGLGSDIAVDRYELRGKNLWNIKNYSPPLLIVATRFQGIFVDPHSRNNQDVVDLPIELRVFYGGNDNLRGFDRQSINNNELGFLTAVSAGLETRLVEVLPYMLEPFFLFDIGQVGEGRFDLSPPLFTTSGLGVRWPSPFGTLRASAARGDILNENSNTDSIPEDWILFLSFGQEF